MLTFRFLDIEADILDAFGDIEIQELLRRLHALLRQHRDDVKRHALPLQHAKAGKGLIERAAAGTGQPMSVIESPWSIDTHTDADIPPLE